jgi:hypothetical protein
LCLGIQLILAARLRVALCFLLVLSRGGKFFFQQCHLLASELGSGLIFDHNPLAGKGLDGPVDTDVQVFGRLNKPFRGCFRHSIKSRTIRSWVQR